MLDHDERQALREIARYMAYLTMLPKIHSELIAITSQLERIANHLTGEGQPTYLPYEWESTATASASRGAETDDDDSPTEGSDPEGDD